MKRTTGRDHMVGDAVEDAEQQAVEGHLVPVTPKHGLSDLGPLAQLRAGRLTRRLLQLALGLFLYGVSLAMMVRGDLGLAPWDVLHSGFIRYVPLSLGQAVIITSFVVLLLWIPLREKPGLGTLANAVLVGVSADATLAVLDAPGDLGWSAAAEWSARIGLMAGGVALCGAATAMYIGAQFGRGPRDGLMTGLHRVTGRSIRLVRTLLEVTVVLIGLALGGVLGLGTIAFAFGIGPVTQALLPAFVVELPNAADAK